jgi:hypothetical protein
MAVDNNGIILSFIFLFEALFSHTTFSAVLYVACFSLAALNVAQIKTPKFTEKWIYALIVYVLGLTAIYGWMMCSKSQ